MKYTVTESFFSDLKKLKGNTRILKKFEAVLFDIEQAGNITEVKNVKKLKAAGSNYRIRIGEYRIGFFIESDELILSRILHRKDIYRQFPP